MSIEINRERIRSAADDLSNAYDLLAHANKLVEQAEKKVTREARFGADPGSVDGKAVIDLARVIPHFRRGIVLAMTRTPDFEQYQRNFKEGSTTYPLPEPKPMLLRNGGRNESTAVLCG